jgi:fumigallin biosynthesis monooxygenase-like protein
MAHIVPARMTADVEGDFVVFLIGMRINRPWKLHKWLPVARAMVPMLRVLSLRKDLGLLGFHTWISPRGPLLVQYWRSVEHLDRFARDSSLPHHAAWRRFNQRVSTSGDVGIWHETYLVNAGDHEAIYANMPRFGLAAAGQHLPVAAHGDRAAQRLTATRRTAEPVYEHEVAS